MPNPNPKVKFQKGNTAAKAGRGKPKNRTTVKKILAQLKNWSEVEGLVEKNIIELLTATDRKTRLEATKAFAEFVKPRKRENVHDVKANIVLEVTGLSKDDF